jgi:hypothetical protein
MATIVETGADSGNTQKKRVVGARLWLRSNRARRYVDDEGRKVELSDDDRATIMRRLLDGEGVQQIADELNRSAAWVYHLYREFGYVIERTEKSMNLVHLTVAPRKIKQRYAADLSRPDAFPPPLDGIGRGKEIPFNFKSEASEKNFLNGRPKAVSEETEVRTDMPSDELSDQQYVEFMDSAAPPRTDTGPAVPVIQPIELVDDPADIEGQLRVAHQLQQQGMQVLMALSEEVKEYKALLVVSDNDIAQLKAEKEQLLDKYEALVAAHDKMAESYRKVQSQNITLQQDAEHWRAHKLAEDRRKSVESSKAIQEGNSQYRQLLEKLRDKG